MARCGYCGAPLKIVLGHKRKDGSRTMKYQCANRFPRKTKGITVYNDNKKCDSGNYDLSNLENTVIDNLIGFQENNDSLLKLSMVTTNLLLILRHLKSKFHRSIKNTKEL